MTINQKISDSYSPKSYIACVLFCFFFGIFGVHRFYVGKVWTGLLMLITLGGFFIWSVVDLVLIIIGEFKDKSGRLVKYEHPQIRK